MVAVDARLSTAPQFAGRIISNIFNAASSLRDWNDARVTRKALSRLTARELDDIGLCAGDIDDISSRHFR